jgi:hypothetical protein
MHVDWPPTFDSDVMVKVRAVPVPDPDDPGLGGETFWAEPVGDDQFRVANLLTQVPFTLGDIVRGVTYDWGTIRAVEVLERSPSTQVAVMFGIQSCASPDPKVADAGLTAVTALMKSLRALGAAVEGHIPGLFSFSFPFENADPDDTEFQGKIADFFAEALTGAQQDPAVRDAFDLVTEQVENNLDDEAAIEIVMGPWLPLGDVDGLLDQTPEDDPRLPPSDYDPYQDPAMVMAVQRVLDQYGSPAGFGEQVVLDVLTRMLETDQRVRNAIAAGNVAGPAEVALRAVLSSQGLPLPPTSGPLL